MNEISINVTLKFDPDMTTFTDQTKKKEYDVLTGEPIPKGSAAVSIKSRYGRRLQSWFMLPATYQKLIAENQ